MNQVPSTVAELGDPIGLGRTAEVFAWGYDQVVKLIRPGFPDGLGESEAEVAALVSAAVLAAPRFLGTTRIEGRFGVLYQRLEGPSMLDLLSRRPWRVDGFARGLAELHAAMHEKSGSGLPGQQAYQRRAIEYAGRHLPGGATAAALARLDDLPGGSVICHGDMHPGNVLMTPAGPIVIDWMTATCGNPTADVARTLYLLRDSGVPDHAPGVQRRLITLIRRRFNGVYLGRYRSLRPLDERELAAWRLPTLAARLAEGIELERAPLLAAIRLEVEGERAAE